MTNSLSENKKTVEFFDSLLDYFEGLNHLQAKVGVHSEAGEENVKKALWNEFGTNHQLGFDAVAIQGEGLKPVNSMNRNSGIFVKRGADISIPARPFIRLYLYPDSVEKLLKRFSNKFNEDLHKRILTKDDSKKTFETMGKESVHLMKQRMYYGNYDKNSNNTIKDQEHNSPLTQYIKGKDSPLINTGELASVLDYKIEGRVI